MKYKISLDSVDVCVFKFNIQQNTYLKVEI